MSPERVADAERALDEIVELNLTIKTRDEEMKRLLEDRRQRLEWLVQEYGDQLSYSEIASRLEVSRARITQLLSGSGSPRHSFLSWGASSLTVVLGSGSNDEGEWKLHEMFEGLARRTGLTFEYEYIEANGLVDLNRPNLVVACGPSHSPAIHTALQYDKSLTFKKDSGGLWFIEANADTKYPDKYRSYIDARKSVDTERGEDPDSLDQLNIDFGYLGRRRRPDGNGTFLCIAGIHLQGTLGALDYLSNNLTQLKKRYGRGQFSTLIRADFDAGDKLKLIGSAEIDTSSRGRSAVSTDLRAS